MFISEGDDLVLQPYSGVNIEQWSWNDTTSEEDVYNVAFHIFFLFASVWKNQYIYLQNAFLYLSLLLPTLQIEARCWPFRMLYSIPKVDQGDHNKDQINTPLKTNQKNKCKMYFLNLKIVVIVNKRDLNVADLIFGDVCWFYMSWLAWSFTEKVQFKVDLTMHYDTQKRKTKHLQ